MVISWPWPAIAHEGGSLLDEHRAIASRGAGVGHGLALHVLDEPVGRLRIELIETHVARANDFVGCRRRQKADCRADAGIRRHDDARQCRASRRAGWRAAAPRRRTRPACVRGSPRRAPPRARARRWPCSRRRSRTTATADCSAVDAERRANSEPARFRPWRHRADLAAGKARCVDLADDEVGVRHGRRGPPRP